MLEVNGNSERLSRSYNELVELQLVLEKAGSFFDQARVDAQVRERGLRCVLRDVKLHAKHCVLREVQLHATHHRAPECAARLLIPFAGGRGGATSRG